MASHDEICDIEMQVITLKVKLKEFGKAIDVETEQWCGGVKPMNLDHYGTLMVNLSILSDRCADLVKKIVAARETTQAKATA
jgi:hypothetical protein